jgi:dienelactone hydrolase
MGRWLVACLAVAGLCLAIVAMERQRAGVDTVPLVVPGGPPVTLYLRAHDSAPAPVVVVSHGFAGSRQLMEPFALTLARAGFVVASFDSMGHGRNPAPMRGDVTRIDGTTRLMVAEARAVAQAALAHPRADGRLAWLGHSMASDIVIRAALEEPSTGAVVAVSMFSQAVSATAPPNLLMIAGDWETRLKAESLRVLALTDAAAGPGQGVGDMAQGTARQVVFAPGVEHVGVLYSATALRAAVDWLGAVFGRDAYPVPVRRGGWIALLLVSVTALAWPLARSLPKGPRPAPLPLWPFLGIVLGPALLVPLVLAPVKVQVLPVLVADYLALHLLVQGGLMLVLLGRAGWLTGVVSARGLVIAAGVALFGIAVFGGLIDRYVANFTPHAGRVLVIAGLALGTVPMMLADAVVTGAGRAAVWRVVLMRGALVGSLMGAVALDFDRLMFLLIILPVIVLFFLQFGTLAGWVGRRTGLPLATGAGLGLVLAWALGVTFPMFAG